MREPTVIDPKRTLRLGQWWRRQSTSHHQKKANPVIIPHRQSCCRHQGSQHEAAGPDLHKIRSTMAGFEPKTTGDAVVMQEMLRGLNELFTAYHARREAAEGHIQSSIWWAICFLGLLAVGFTTLLRMR